MNSVVIPHPSGVGKQFFVPAEIGWADYDGLLDRYVELLDEAKKSRAVVERLIAERKEAEVRDRENFAAAIRAGKPEPKREALAVEEQIAAEQRRAEALELAARTAGGEYREFVVDNRDRLSEKANAQIEKIRARYDKALSQLVAEHRELVAANEFDRFIAAFPRHSMKVDGARLSTLAGPRQDTYSSAELFAALAEYSQPRRPQPDDTEARFDAAPQVKPVLPLNAA